MFQFDWAARELWSKEPDEIPAHFTTPWNRAIQRVMLLHWQEHCVECAPPDCYAICPLYVQRKDRKCARLVYGMVRNHDFPGLLSCGADLRFRRWGKIEARLTGRHVSVSQLRLLDRADQTVKWLAATLASFLSGITPKLRAHGALTLYRGNLLDRLGRRGSYDNFVVECHSFHSSICKLIVELRRDCISIFRQSLDLQPGYNLYSLSIPLPPDFGSEDNYLLMVYPDGDQEVRLVFSWLDFVIYDHATIENARAPAHRDQQVVSSRAVPAPQLKCVAWDLDNTLWRGILAEDGKYNLQLRPDAVDLIHRLDERGIIQTIVSKNNLQEAMAVLKKHGLDEFFLHPAINWGQKSTNLQQIADRLNINLDTFALIDDSAFERREVSSALPMVRVYPEDSLLELLAKPEFDVTVTDASRRRRHSYLTEAQRAKTKEDCGTDYLTFLRSCQLKLKIFRPTTGEEIARCLELIQRSNQLNLSSNRYNSAQFKALLSNHNVLSLAMECEDRFGDYGIVGFASIDVSSDTPVATDFVLSCRVAQKRVEHAFYGWLASCAKRDGASRFQVNLVRTDKNIPLVKVFEDLPFTAVKAEGNLAILSMDLTGEIVTDDVVALDDTAMRGLSAALTR